MCTKRIYLHQYFDTFVVADVVMRELLFDPTVVDNVVQQGINEIRITYLQLLSDMDGMTSDVYHFLESNFYVDVEKIRDVRRLETIVHIIPYISVDKDFYDAYYDFLSKHLNM